MGAEGPIDVAAAIERLYVPGDPLRVGVLSRARDRREIREYVRALPGEKRLEFVSAAIGRGDVRTCVAVLDAPAFLSGMERATPEQWATLRADARRAADPDTAAALGRARAMLDRVAQGMGVFQRHFGRPFDGADAIAKRIEERIKATRGDATADREAAALAALDGGA